MDEQRFDAALRALQAGTTRRAGLAAAFGALLGGGLARVAARSRGADGEAGPGAGDPGVEGPCGDRSRAANACTKNSQCCTGICNLKAGKKNKDRKGRCRCVRPGGKCTEDRNCCAGARCLDGACTVPAGCSDRVWASAGTFGEKGTGADQFRRPYSLALSPDGLAAYVLDQAANRISVWTRQDANSAAWSHEGNFGQKSTDPATGFTNLAAIQFTANGRTMAIANNEPGNRWVSLWTRDGSSLTAWTYQSSFGSDGRDEDQFALVADLALSPDGLTALVADPTMQRISMWTRPDAGSTAWTWQVNFGETGDNRLKAPSGVALSSDGLTAVVGEYRGHRVSVWTRPNAASTAWAFQTSFGSAGSGPDQFSTPFRIALSSNGRTAWIGDYLNTRVAIWTRSAAASTDWTHLVNLDPVISPVGIAVTADGTTALIAQTNDDTVAQWTALCPV